MFIIMSKALTLLNFIIYVILSNVIGKSFVPQDLIFLCLLPFWQVLLKLFLLETKLNEQRKADGAILEFLFIVLFLIYLGPITLCFLLVHKKGEGSADSFLKSPSIPVLRSDLNLFFSILMIQKSRLNAIKILISFCVT